MAEETMPNEKRVPEAVMTEIRNLHNLRQETGERIEMLIRTSKNFLDVQDSWVLGLDGFFVEQPGTVEVDAPIAEREQENEG